MGHAARPGAKGGAGLCTVPGDQCQGIVRHTRRDVHRSPVPTSPPLVVSRRGQATRDHQGPTHQRCVTMEHGPAIFAELFDLPRIRRLRKTHHFRYSLQTDGVGLALSFGKWVHSVHKYGPGEHKRKRRHKKSKAGATTKSVTELRTGFAHSAQNKIIASLDELKGYTVRCVDPGVRRTYTSINLLTEEKDARSSVMSMRLRMWRSRTQSHRHGTKMKRWHDTELGEVRKQLNTCRTPTLFLTITLLMFVY